MGRVFEKFFIFLRALFTSGSTILNGSLLILFTKIFEWFAILFAQLPLLAVVGTIFTLGYSAFIATATSILGFITPSIPPTVLLAWGWIMPTNFTILFGALLSCKLTRFAYDQHMKLVELKVITGLPRVR